MTGSQTEASPKPIQAGDYGKDETSAPDKKTKGTGTHTDGRKTLALWSNEK